MEKGPLSIRIEGIQPILSVRNMNASRAFYVGILGFTEAEWGTDEFTSISRDTSSIFLCEGGQGSPGTWLWVGFDGNIFELHERLKSVGVPIRLAPTNYPWAMEMQIEDPDGHVLRFGTDSNAEEPFMDLGGNR